MRTALKKILLVALLVGISSIGSGAEVEVLLKSGTSWDGGGFTYPQGQPEITIARVTLEEGQETPFHCHPVPTFGYLLRGTLEVLTGSGESTVIREGEAAIEVMDKSHRGRAVKGPVEILVFYAGVVDVANTLPVGEKGCGDPQLEPSISLVNLNFRNAVAGDVQAIVGLLSDDPLGAARERPEDPLPESYRRAFQTIDQDPNNELIVAESDEAIIGVVQVTFIPNLSYQGSWRAQVEGVRVHKDYRAQGVGRKMILRAIDAARERRCGMVQLTADKSRADAIRFYQELGFKATHEGLKLWL